MLRINGELVPMEDHEPCSPGELQRVLFAALTQKQREKFEAELELDISYSVPGKARFRVNLYRQRESIGAAFRLIPYEIKSSRPSASRRPSRTSPGCRAAWCSSPARPAPASRRRWPP